MGVVQCTGGSIALIDDEYTTHHIHSPAPRFPLSHFFLFSDMCIYKILNTSSSPLLFKPHRPPKVRQTSSEEDLILISFNLP